jgi:hypothetical protein
VEYNTSTNPTFEGAVRDTSGRGLDGVLHSSVSYDANAKSFGSFGGGGLETMATNNLLESNGKHSFSAWIRFDTSGTWYAVYGVGGNVTFSGNNSITVYIGSGVFRLESRGGSYRDYGYTFNHGKWVHMAVVYDGTGGYDNFDIYMDMVKLSLGSSSGNGTTAITLPIENQTVRFGSSAEASPGATSGSYLPGAMSSVKFYDTVLTFEEVKTLYDMGRLGNGLYPLHIDAPVYINGPLYASGTILNISQFVDSTSRTVSNNNSTIQTGYTTPAVPMKAGSKVKLEFHIPYRQDGGSGWKGGYHWIYFRLNKTVAGVAANTWVFLLTSGYHMDYASSVISNYSNSCYLPLSVPEDFTIEFQHRWRPYENTSEVMYINGGHHINITTDSNLLKLGFDGDNMGWSKYIITEISK